LLLASATTRWKGIKIPFKSKQQRKYLYATNPEVAAEFEAHTPKGAKLPYKVKKSKGKKK
jgi:hypothetical protein